jgi:hypothetical protein
MKKGTPAHEAIKIVEAMRAIDVEQQNECTQRVSKRA